MTDNSTRVKRTKKRPKNRKNPQKTTLTAPQLAAVEALMISPTIKGAAARAGVPLRTLESWLSGNELFKMTLKEQRTEAREAITRNLVAVNAGALAVALRMMSDPLESSAIRMRVVEFVFEQTHKLLEQGDMAERLQAIEELLEAQENEKKFF